MCGWSRLSGLSPFMGDSDAETMCNVTAGNFDFHSPEFDSVSDDAKDMITNLLQPDKTYVNHLPRAPFILLARRSTIIIVIIRRFLVRLLQYEYKRITVVRET